MRNLYIAFAVMVLCSASAQNFSIYDVDLYDTEEKDSFAFISLSDSYQVSEHPDSLTIPQSKNHLQVFELDGKYRAQLLYKTKIRETDNVYVYDYYKDKLVTLKVSQLEAYACLNVYASADEGPFPDYYYMIGFKIDKKHLKGSDEYYSNSLAYFGNKNPFVRGGVKPLVWKKITANEFPAVKLTPENEKLIQGQSYTFADVWKSEADGFNYFLRDIIADNRIYARWLLVFNSKSDTLILNRMYADSEGTMQARLNYSDSEYPSVSQFAGRLFKNKPPVVFGFEDISFGCPGITFLSVSEDDLYINCDNRH